MQRIERRHGARADRRRRGSGPGPCLLMASKVCGDRVMSQGSESLGVIKEVVLDVARGQLAYAVVTAGGFMGVGERTFAVPWSALRLDLARKCFVLEAGKELLDKAPQLDQDQLPGKPDVRWHQRLHRYYGSRLYWD